MAKMDGETKSETIITIAFFALMTIIILADTLK